MRRFSQPRLLYGFLALILAACSSEAAEERYQTAVAEIGDVRDVVPATGTLLASGMAEIRAPRPGVITAVYVEEGDTVRAGTVMATLSDPTRAPTIDAARASATASAAAMREAEIALTGAQERLNRSRALQERGFVSAIAVANAQVEVDQARAGIDRLVSERAAAQARARLASAEGAGSDIVAPLDGLVSLVDARIGQRVTPDDARALFQTVQDEKNMTLEIFISEADLQRVSLDSQVIFTVESFPGINEQARLISIGRAPIRDGRFVSYRAIAEYTNNFNILRPGMSASVQLIKADARNVLRIPVSALIFRPVDYMPPMSQKELQALIRREHGDMGRVRASANGFEIGRALRDGKRIIFVLMDDKPERREVSIGAETDEFIEVTEGLKEGDVVIVKATADPRDAV